MGESVAPNRMACELFRRQALCAELATSLLMSGNPAEATEAAHMAEALTDSASGQACLGRYYCRPVTSRKLSGSSVGPWHSDSRTRHGFTRMKALPPSAATLNLNRSSAKSKDVHQEAIVRLPSANRGIGVREGATPDG